MLDLSQFEGKDKEYDGPWYTGGVSGRMIYDDSGYNLADVDMKVRAELIAAAPDLLAECRRLQENNRELTTDRDRWMEANGANTVSLHHCYVEIDQLKAANKAMREALQFIASAPGKDVKEGAMADRMRNKARTTLTQYPDEPQ